MPYDLLVNTDGEIEYDNFGDYTDIRGDNNVRQQIRLAIQRGLGLVETSQLTQERMRTIRRNVRDSLNECPYVDQIASIQLETPNDESLLINIETRSESLTARFDR